MPQRIRVFLCIPTLNVGGAERAICKIAANHDSSKVDVLVCCFSSPGPLSKEIEEAGVEIRYLGKNSPFDIRVLFRFYRLLKEYKPAIVHTFLITTGFWALLPVYFARVPLFIYGLRSIYEQNPWYVHVMEEIVLRAAHKVSCVSQNVLNTYAIRKPWINNKAYVLRNGIDTKQYFLGSSNRGAVKVIGAIGRLVSSKGYSILIKAMQSLVIDHPELKLWIIGDGPLRKQLTQLVGQLNLLPNVEFLGQRSDIPDLLQNIDIFASATLWEGISNSHLEAMSAGKPIVSTKVEGVMEILDENTAILVDPGNPDSLAKALKRMISDPELRLNFARQARSKAEKYYDIRKIVREVEVFYSHALVD